MDYLIITEKQQSKPLQHATALLGLMGDGTNGLKGKRMKK
jgi:hypothetical protein